uniref:Uncharacterized protein n=1 Tax=Strigamia maritima TaxID=126957 RepID=T1JBP7_STRMM
MKTLHNALVVGIIILSLGTPVGSSDKIERPKYFTAYACEGSILTIQCYEGHTIDLIRANYGRFSISVCNEHGVQDWSVNCMSNRSFRVLQERCSQQNSCSIRADTQVFSDPCPGTWKYLEAHYLCSPASTSPPTTTKKAIPPWLITRTTPASDWLLPTTTQTTVTTSATTTRTSTNGPTNHPIFTTTSSTAAPAPLITTPIAVEETLVKATKPTQVTKNSLSMDDVMTVAVSTSTPIMENDHCPPIRARGVQWDWTRRGEEAVVPCPIGVTGTARWKCDYDSVQWVPRNPDLSGCQLTWISDLAADVDSDKFAVNIASELATVTKNQALYGGDTILATAMLKKMADKMEEKLNSLKVKNKEEVITDSVIQTSSNLLNSDPKQRLSWHDLSRLQQMRAATSLLEGLDQNAYLLADQIDYEKVLVQAADKNVMMSMKVYKVQNMKEIYFPTNEDLNNVIWDQATDSITLPVDAILDRTEKGLVKAIFFTFGNLDEILQNFEDDYFNDYGVNVSRVLNSHIISAIVGRASNNIPLSQPVTISFRHLRDDNISNPTCVFWDYDKHTWSDDGCSVKMTNRTHTVCSCTHLTNFAVLMNFKGVQVSAVHETALQTITLIGCVVSIVCLFLSFLTFTIFRTLRSDRTTIHKNLCACLLVAEIIFLVGVGRTDERLLCGVVAGLLHFFFLCSFAWMFLEGFQLYVMLIEVFETERSRVRWYYALAYGVPAFIVCVSCIIDPWSYGTDRYCWLRTDNYFVFSFVGPVIAVIIINFLFLSVAIFMMCRHSNITTTLKNKEQTKLANMRIWIRGAVMLVILLGLTWTFGLFYLNQESVVMAYAFTILNSLQGLFIFIFHCVQNEKVQKEYKRLLWKSLCLAMCIKNKGRRSSFYINSNGTSSVPVSNSNGGVQQNNFKRFWEGPNCKGNTLGRVAGLPGSNHHPSDGFPESELEKSSSKSSNRDSGHGGSDREDSSASNPPDLSGGTPYNHRPVVDYGGLTSELEDPQLLTDSYCQKKLRAEQLQQQPLPPLHDPRLANRLHRPLRTVVHPVRLNPHNHIYMDIDRREEGVAEPVYEEIERQRPELLTQSDVSDEDTKRRSDVSRQSSGSYGDSRPLIPPQGQIGPSERWTNRTGNQSQSHHYPHRAMPSEPTLPLVNHVRSEYPRAALPDVTCPSGEERHVARGSFRGDEGEKEQRNPNMDNGLLVAMFDGRKVVSRLQPHHVKKIPQPCRTNSFSEC